MASANPSPVVSDQKKRAFDALERRFAAAAKSDLLHEDHLRSKKRSSDPSRRPQSHDPKRPVAASDATLSSPPSISDPSYSIKGDSGSSNATPQRRISDGETHPVYSKICETMHENLLQAAIMDSSRRDAVHRIVGDIIGKGEEAGKFARGAKSLKLDSWILLDNYVAKNDGLADARMRALKSHSKRSKKHMSMKQHRKVGSFNLPKEFHNFDLFKPMHEMWKEYINELTKENGKKKLSDRLLTADLHGAYLLVVECRDVTFKGVSGIMIRDTAETFGIITEDNRFRVVPKMGSVFIFQAGCWKITIYGDKLSPKGKLKESRAREQLQHRLSR
ncbi:uncharacterized protein LOC109725734 [Ananas comosus]|uniref:Uncharacterized protein LOC109725734 n=1 Tax=Ananas comosus TaxID=4615 RepID=A0A6P5GXW3_ANACO|nr:uncharacterized protein LOC109725734 [Ananas comosus]XP_020110643.1 uncharacterized protein LOC109725734 [Ananas comosus]XP_020110644.1 uncharacterized protein LOC109725734 [Ananas comosus]